MLQGAGKGLKTCYIQLYNKGVAEVEWAKNQIIHYPRLDTVLSVERFILAHSGEFKRRKLWEKIPKKMMYQTYCTILDYLLVSGKISIDKEGKIGWIYNPALFRKYINRRDLAR